MATYTNCKVGAVQSVVTVHSGTVHGYGFSILGDHRRPLVAFTFATEADAEQARVEIEKVVAKAVEITPQG